MVTIGKVVVGQSNQIKVKIDSPSQTYIQSPTHPGSGIHVGDLLDVNDTILADGYTLRYDITTHQYHTVPTANVDITLLDGGTY